jgi:hypothetical protein
MSREAYEAYDQDVTRRLDHAETRIKYWVVAGICANLLALVGLGIPMVYYLGTLNAQTTQALTTVNTSAAQLSQLNSRLARLEFQAASREAWMVSQGYNPPHTPGE